MGLEPTSVFIFDLTFFRGISLNTVLVQTKFTQKIHQKLTSRSSTHTHTDSDSIHDVITVCKFNLILKKNCWKSEIQNCPKVQLFADDTLLTESEAVNQLTPVIKCSSVTLFPVNGIYKKRLSMFHH